MKLFDDIRQIKGVGDKTAMLFNKLGVFNVDELLNFYPRTYVNYPEPSGLSSVLPDTYASFKLTILDDFVFRKIKSLNIGSGKATDKDKVVYITFFNTPYYKDKLVKGKTYIFYGRIIFENNRYKLEQPLFFDEDEYASLRTTLQPVYSLVKGLSTKIITKTVKSAIEDGQYPYFYEEYLPYQIIKDFELIPRSEALCGMHFPKDYDSLKAARNRLVFDELFDFLLAIKMLKDDDNRTQSGFQMIETVDPLRLMEALPYKLTNAQNKVYKEIVEDMCSGNVMNRLIQGDVGSGKTIVAFLALLLCVTNNYQGAMMAPTELLAMQHYSNLIDLTEKYNLPIKAVLLTGSVSAKNKKEIYKKIKNNEYNVVIGTHALIQDAVEFNNLALVVTDEQHRFGVRQRQLLNHKSQTPHILVMSATPIPRTLAMVLYKDLLISVLDEKPSNRFPIKNCVVNTSYRKKIYDFVLSKINENRQAYFICPMVMKSDGLENVENVIDYTEKLKKVFPANVRIEFLHGQMKPSLKNEIMENFLNHNIDILVSTTVIEVGIDVPNATVIVIENADRFGLSQLHQLRGRIGRSSLQSYAVFINGKDDENKRLEIMNKSNDGFEIAAQDLKLRGAGDLFGIRQSGQMGFKLADIYEDSVLIMRISEVIDNIIRDDPNLEKPDNRQLQIHFKQNINNLIDFGTI